jgi:hypothetical protein
MRFATIVLLFSTITVHSQTLYLDYGHWEQMPASFRQMYIAGAFDAVSVITVPEGAMAARHYNECVAKARLSIVQLEKNMKEYAETQPDAPSKPVPTILMRYLTSLCGLPGATVRG